jgi:hypothetical protein
MSLFVNRPAMRGTAIHVRALVADAAACAGDGAGAAAALTAAVEGLAGSEARASTLDTCPGEPMPHAFSAGAAVASQVAIRTPSVRLRNEPFMPAGPR